MSGGPLDSGQVRDFDNAVISIIAEEVEGETLATRWFGRVVPGTVDLAAFACDVDPGNGLAVTVPFGHGAPSDGDIVAVFEDRTGDRWLFVPGRSVCRVWTYTSMDGGLICHAGVTEGFTSVILPPNCEGTPTGSLLTGCVNGTSDPTLRITSPPPNRKVKITLDSAGGAGTLTGRIQVSFTPDMYLPDSVAWQDAAIFTLDTVGKLVEIDFTGNTLFYTRIIIDTIVGLSNCVVSAGIEDDFNQPGTAFSGDMRNPALGDQLDLIATSPYGNGHDGDASLPGATTVNLATNSIVPGRALPDAPYTYVVAYVYLGCGRVRIGPIVPDAEVGDEIVVYVAEMKEGASDFWVGKYVTGYVDALDLSGSGATIFVPNTPNFTMPAPGSCYMFAQRLPNYNNLTINGTIVCDPMYAHPNDDEPSAPGMVFIRSLLGQGGSGFVHADGCGYRGGLAGKKCDASGRLYAGRGRVIDRVSEGQGIGVWGGGWGGAVELCDPLAVKGAGGAGGGAGAGGEDGHAGLSGTHKVSGSDVPNNNGQPGGDAIGPLSDAGWAWGHLLPGAGGGAGGRGPVSGIGQSDPSEFGDYEPGAPGGGVVFIAAPTMQSIQVTANAGGGTGASYGGGGGGSIHVISGSLFGLTLQTVGTVGGIPYSDAFHNDGTGGAGGGGLIHRTGPVTGGSASGVVIDDTLAVHRARGGWSSDVVDLGTPGKPLSLLVHWSLDGTDNIPPVLGFDAGPNDACSAAAYTLTGVSDGNLLKFNAPDFANYRYWRFGVILDTGPTVLGDTPALLDARVCWITGS